MLGDEAHRAQLVVIGDRGLGGVRGLLVGSVAAGLAAGAVCPVVVVRGGDLQFTKASSRPSSSAWTVRRPVRPRSRSATTPQAVALRVVHTWHDLVVDPTMAPLLDWEAVESDEREVLAERLAGWAEEHPDVRVERVVTRDRPAHALEESKHAQLVVVGSHGRGRMSGLLLGSVSHAALQRAECPVAVVRHDAGV